MVHIHSKGRSGKPHLNFIFFKDVSMLSAAYLKTRVSLFIKVTAIMLIIKGEGMAQSSWIIITSDLIRNINIILVLYHFTYFKTGELTGYSRHINESNNVKSTTFTLSAGSYSACFAHKERALHGPTQGHCDLVLSYSCESMLRLSTYVSQCDQDTHIKVDPWVFQMKVLQSLGQGWT